MPQAFVHRSRRDTCLVDQPPGSRDGTFNEGPMNAGRGGRCPTQTTDFVTILSGQIGQVFGRVSRLLCGGLGFGGFGNTNVSSVFINRGGINSTDIVVIGTPKEILSKLNNKVLLND